MVISSLREAISLRPHVVWFVLFQVQVRVMPIRGQAQKSRGGPFELFIAMGGFLGGGRGVFLGLVPTYGYAPIFLLSRRVSSHLTSIRLIRNCSVKMSHIISNRSRIVRPKEPTSKWSKSINSQG